MGRAAPHPLEYDRWMAIALREARQALHTEDVPVGAVLLDSTGAPRGRGRNQREAHGDPTAHAEIVAIQEAAAALGHWRLEGCTLVVTLEPCAMCAGAIVLARIDRLIYGTPDPKAGAAGSAMDILRDRHLNHWTHVYSGVRAQECAALLQGFFAHHRRGPEHADESASRER